jgi:DHA2 family multidrug resistance protein-like MFS transporter
MADAARNSVGAATQIATNVAGPAGDALGTAARSAFVDALGIVFIAAAAVAFLGSLLVFRFMPAQDLVADTVGTQQVGA